jgi:hypothetical protein
MYVQEEFVRAMEQALAPLDIEISMSVSSQLCAALAIIPEKERVRPAILIDVGYTHTDVSIVENAALTDIDHRYWRKAFIERSRLRAGYTAGDGGAGEKTVRLFTGTFEQHRDCAHTRGRKARGSRGDRADIGGARGRTGHHDSRGAQGDGRFAGSEPHHYLTGGGIAMMKGGIDYLKRGLQLDIQRDTPWVADMDTPNYTSCFAALDFVLRATSDDIVTNTSPGTLMDRLRNLFTK